MLEYKVKEILLAAGKKYPAKWLMKVCGFDRGKAYKIINNKQKSINLADVSHLCYALQCTPNDILYWRNGPKFTVRAEHPLATLTPPSEIKDWDKVFLSMTPKEVADYHAEFVKRIMEKRAQQAGVAESANQ